MSNQEKALEVSEIIASVHPNERPQFIDLVFDAVVNEPGISTSQFQSQLEVAGILTDYGTTCNSNQAICKRKTP